MKRALYIFYFLLLSGTNSISGQNLSPENKGIKKLKTVAPENEGRVYLKAVLSASDNLNVFLINRSNSVIRTYIGPSSYLEFSKEAMDLNGVWQPIDHGRPYILCGTGLYSGLIKPNHYTWQKFYKRKYQGDYNTEIRFSYRLNDSVTITSNTQTVNINPDLFLSYYDRSIRQLDLLLQSDTITKNHRLKLMRIKLQHYRKHKTIEETISLGRHFVAQFPESEIGKYYLATSYIGYLSKNRETLDLVAVQALLSRAIGEWALIKDDSETKRKALAKEKHFKKLLLSKKDWLSLPKNNFEEINGEFYSTITTDSEEVVKVRFKQY